MNKVTKFLLALKLGGIGVVVLVLFYLFADFTSSTYIEKYVEAANNLGTDTISTSKRQFKQVYIDQVDNTELPEIVESEKSFTEASGRYINIEEYNFDGYNLRGYDPTKDRWKLELNAQAYDLNLKILQEQLSTLERSNYAFVQSYAEYINPLVMLALACIEVEGQGTYDVLWTPIIYDRAFLDGGVSPDGRSFWEMVCEDGIASIGYKTFVDWGLEKMLYCGGTGTLDKEKGKYVGFCDPTKWVKSTINFHDAASSTPTVENWYHYTGDGYNDNDSLGPMQILRRYKQDEGYTLDQYDLMSWGKNAEYLYEKYFEKVLNVSKDYRDIELTSSYQVVALVAIGHNSGEFIHCSHGYELSGSAFETTGGKYDLAMALTSNTALKVLNEIVDAWWEEYTYGDGLAGQYHWRVKANPVDTLKEHGIDVTAYARKGYEDSHKFSYPVKALLNYMSLQRLYDQMLFPGGD